MMMCRAILITLLLFAISGCGHQPAKREPIEKQIEQDSQKRIAHALATNPVLAASKRNKEIGQAKYLENLASAPKRSPDDPLYIYIVYSYPLDKATFLPKPRHWNPFAEKMYQYFKTKFPKYKIGLVFANYVKEKTWRSDLAKIVGRTPSQQDIIIWINSLPVQTTKKNCQEVAQDAVPSMNSSHLVTSIIFSAYGKAAKKLVSEWCKRDLTRELEKFLDRVVQIIHKHILQDVPSMEFAVELSPPFFYDVLMAPPEISKSSSVGGGRRYDDDDDD